jgi:hypothetical protein
LFSPAAKVFGICQQKQPKMTVFCPVAQRKVLEFANKSTQIDIIAAKNLEFKATQIDCLLFSRAAKNFGIKLLKLTVFCPAANEKLKNLPTNATKIDCLLICRAANFFGVRPQKQLKLTVFCAFSRAVRIMDS